MNVLDESLLLDNPEYKFLEPMLKKLWVPAEARRCLFSISVISIRRPTVFTTAARNLRFERVGPPVLQHVTARRRVARSFHRLSRRDRSAEKRGRWSWFSGRHRFEKAARIPQFAPNAVSSRTSMVRGLSPKSGSAAVGSLRDGVRTATEVVLLLGQRSRFDGSRMDVHSFLEHPHVSCFRVSVAGVSNFGTDSSTMPRQRPVTRRSGGLVVSIEGQKLPLWQRPSGPASPQPSSSRISQRTCVSPNFGY